MTSTQPARPSTIALPTFGQVEWLFASIDWQNQQIGELMATINDLKTAADQLASNEAALSNEVGTLTTAVQNLVTTVDQLRSNSNLNAADQSTLDAAVQEVTNAATDLAAQTRSLATEQTAAEGANPPPANNPPA